MRGIGRALVQDVLSRKAAQGGSTIAQQFVKNALRAQSDRTVFQKMREAALAYHLTRKWPKSKILTRVPELDLLRQRRLRRRVGRAHLLRQPARPQGLRHARQPVRQGAQARRGRADRRRRGQPRRPMTPSPIPQAALARRNLVLKDMFDQGLLPLREYRDARIQALPASIDIKPPTVRTKAPYFTTWVRQQLVDRFGARTRVRGRAEGEDHARPRAPGRRRPGGQQVPGQPGGPVGRRSWRSTTRPARCARWSAAATTPRARSTSRRRASASPARRSSRSSSPRR